MIMATAMPLRRRRKGRIEMKTHGKTFPGSADVVVRLINLRAMASALPVSLGGLR